MRQARAPGAPQPSNAVPIAVAVITSLGVVIGAVITASTSGSPGAQVTTAAATTAQTPTPTQTPTATGNEDVAIDVWGRAEVDPPPTVKYTFEGRAEGLGEGDYVMVLGQFDDPDDRSPSAANSENTPPPFESSAPARPSADGSWRITWTVPSAPKTERFQAIVAKGIQVSLTNQFNSPAPGHGNVYIYGAEEIRRLGTNAPSVIASDEATLDELSPGPE